MGQQIAIRSDKARALVDQLSERHGKSITAVIEEALERMDAQDHAKWEAEVADRRARLQVAIDHDRAILRQSNEQFEIEDLYGEDGLPI